METKIQSTELLLAAWAAGVEALLFPSDLVAKLEPDIILDGFGDDISSVREKFRDDVDTLIGRIFTFDNPEDLWSLLRETDPKITALYYNRILAATFSLEVLKADKPAAQVPASWEVLIRSLLFQKQFQ